MNLSPVQSDILHRLANGQVPKQIHRDAGVNPNTYKDLMKSIRDRLGAPTTHAAIATAIRQGIIK